MRFQGFKCEKPFSNRCEIFIVSATLLPFSFSEGTIFLTNLSMLIDILVFDEKFRFLLAVTTAVLLRSQRILMKIFGCSDVTSAS